MERTFANYCSQGLLINAQLLYNEENKNINTYVDNEYAFRCSCENGHLEVAK